jgi:tRNA 2-thiouridine synthesizing protein A
MADSRAQSDRSKPLLPLGFAPRPGTAASASSGTHQNRTGQLRSVLRQYVSSVLLDSVIQNAFARHELQARSVPELYEALTADCMIGLRMFVPDDLLPELMLALADFLEELHAEEAKPQSAVFAIATDGIATIDVRGRGCPLPIVFAARAMRELRLNDKLRVLADDRAFIPDIRNWAKRRHHVFLAVDTLPGHFAALIQKSG